MKTKTGIELIAAERERQKERFPESQDDLYTSFELTRAAIAYARHLTPMDHIGDSDMLYPWPKYTFGASDKDMKRNLVKAAALLLAEIERIEREDLRHHQPR